jgi:hypothetical protein
VQLVQNKKGVAAEGAEKDVKTEALEPEQEEPAWTRL